MCRLNTDLYNAACDLENGFDSGALERLAGVSTDTTLDEDLDVDFYTFDELRTLGR